MAEFLSMVSFGVPQFLMAALGVVVGIVFGALPGMTATMAIAVFLPMTYAYDLSMAMYLLLGLYVGGISGGLIPAILINIPGTPSSVTTGFDGHPMAMRGEGERALKIGIVSSFIGGMFSLLCLCLFTPPLARLAIKFSAVEKFLIILFALTVVAALSNGHMLEGIFSGFLGIFVSLIGTFADNSKSRLIPPIGNLEVDLYDGFQLLPVLIGLFALAQIMEAAEDGMKSPGVKSDDLGHQSRKFKFSDLKGQGINLIRSAAIGTFMGILPGVGGSAASILAYSQAKNFSKHPELLGTGVAEGLVASESANNGLTGGALIPLLSLGIPGDSTTAILVSAFMLQGVQVGPLFITNNTDLWYTILFALAICNIIMFVVMFYPIKYIAKVIEIPMRRIYPVIVLLCVVGSWSTRNGNMFDVWTMLIFGVFGYICHKIHLPTASFLIGFILGGDLEKYFVDSIKGSAGSLMCFFTRPIGWVIWLMIFASIAYSLYSDKKAKEIEKKNAKA